MSEGFRTVIDGRSMKILERIEILMALKSKDPRCERLMRIMANPTSYGVDLTKWQRDLSGYTFASAHYACLFLKERPVVAQEILRVAKDPEPVAATTVPVTARAKKVA